MVASQKQEDRELVERSLQGDKSAFGALVSKYQGMIYGFITSQIRDFSEAEDLTQNTFIKAYRKLSQLRDLDAFRGWLRSIAVTESKNWIASHKPTVPLDATDGTTLHDQQALYQWQQQQNRPEILEALDTLTDEHREVINLYYLGGLSCRDIAVDLDVSVSAVEKRLSRARMHLRSAMPKGLGNSFDKHKLPGEFQERVLRKLSLCPVMDGFVTARLDDNAGTVVIGADSGSETPSFVFLSMERADAELLLYRHTCTSPESKSRMQFAAATLSVLATLGIRLKEVRLGLDGDQCCAATVVLVQNGTETETVMPANDALCLAGYGRVLLYAEGSVVSAKRVAVPGVTHMPTLEADGLEQSIRYAGQLDQLIRTGFTQGLSPRTGLETLNCAIDYANSKVEVGVQGLDGPPVTLDLEAYSAGFAHALVRQDPDPPEFYRHDDGSKYQVSFPAYEEGVRVVLTPVSPR